MSLSGRAANTGRSTGSSARRLEQPQRLRKRACPLGRQDGVALGGVIVLTLVMLILGFIGVRGVSTELRIAGNDLRSRQALAVAEAGLSYGLSLIDAAGDALDDELEASGTGGALEAVGSVVTVDGTSYRFRNYGGTRSEDGYYVRVLDNYDEETGADVPGADTDSIVDVEALGKVGLASRVVRARIRLLAGGSAGPGCGIVVNGDLKVSGVATITGTNGCAHANRHVDISGNTIFDAGVTGSGAMNISGVPVVGGEPLDTNEEKADYAAAHSGQPAQEVPNVRPFNFGAEGTNLAEAIRKANGYRLDANCRVYGGSTAWTCTENPPNCTGGNQVANLSSGGKWDGWECSSDSGSSPAAKWVLGGDSFRNAAFFVEGWVNISGNPGESGPAWQTTLVALNSIDISGNPEMTPYATTGDLANILMVSGNDIGLGGALGASGAETGIFAHQQIKNNGNFLLNGFLVSENAGGNGVTGRSWAGDPAPNKGSGKDVISEHYELSGNPQIHYDGLSTIGFSPSPAGIEKILWSEVRSF